MFITYDAAKVDVPWKLSTEGESLWRYAERNLHTTWFYIEYKYECDEIELRSMIMLNTLEQFLTFFAREKSSITEVNIVTPRHVNHTLGWAMNRVRRILKALPQETEHTSPVIIYEVEDGGKIIDSPYDESEISLGETEIVFAIS